MLMPTNLLAFDYLNLIDTQIKTAESNLEFMQLPEITIEECESDRERQVYLSGYLEALQHIKCYKVLHETHR